MEMQSGLFQKIPFFPEKFAVLENKAYICSGNTTFKVK